MSDNQKTTKKTQSDPVDANQKQEQILNQSLGHTRDMVQDDGVQVHGDESGQDSEKELEKAALDAVIQQVEQEKPKKGKSQYETMNGNDIKPGMLVRVHQKIVETNAKGEEKERIQVFQGMVLAHKHGAETGATITVRKVSEGIGVEKIFPLNMPSIEKIELVRTYQVKQARPYYLRTTKKRLKEIKE